MCTSIVSNGKKTIIGWNLDLLDMEYQVVAEDDKVYIAIMDEKRRLAAAFWRKCQRRFCGDADMLAV